MAGAVGIIVVIIGLLLSVALHEIGHMVPAKRFGAAVSEYSVGFGPVIAQRTWRGTRYVIRWILLGGYVRILGMLPPARPGTRTHRGSKLTLAEQARRQSAEEMIDEGATGIPFYQLSVLQKITVMMGGPVMNLLISAVLTAVALMGIGIPTASLTLADAPQTITMRDGEEFPGPAYQAGIRAGDTVRSWGDTSVHQWDDLVGAITHTGSEPTAVTIERDGVEQTMTVTAHQVSDGSYITGIVAGVERRSAQVSTVGSVWAQMGIGTAAIVVKLPVAVWNVVESLVTGKDRGEDSVMSVVGVGRVAAEVSSSAAHDAQSGGTDFAGAAGTLLMLLASLNMALFVFNLIPLLPLDGGHIASARFEGTRRMWARLRNRPDPGPVDTARMLPVTYAVMLILVVMTIVLVIADIVVPVTLPL